MLVELGRPDLRQDTFVAFNRRVCKVRVGAWRAFSQIALFAVVIPSFGTGDRAARRPVPLDVHLLGVLAGVELLLAQNRLCDSGLLCINHCRHRLIAAFPGVYA